MSKFYITTSIPYANDKPHMGHTLDPLYADILARYYRMKDLDVFFLVGLDENGQKVYQRACKEKVKTEEWIKKIKSSFLDFHKKLDMSYDRFIETGDVKEHHPAAKEIWKRAKENGDIYKKKYKGLYCVGCEAFFSEKELPNGKCPDHLTEPEEIEEENYFFKLSKYTDFLKKHFEKNPDFVYPKNFYNEAYQMILDGLEDVSISRPKSRLPWGVPVPDDPEHVMYVWFDALVNYLSGIGFPKNKKTFEKYWPADIEIVGKDNNRWHTLLWPAMLKSARLKLPKKVFIHAYILGKGGVKMSKTIGNVVDPLEIIKKYGVDPFRYYLISKIPISSDGVFDEDYFKEVYTSDLANGLGNLVQRVAVMVKKYFNGVIPKGSTKIDEVPYKKYMESLEFHKAIECIWLESKNLDKLIDEGKPWELAKKNDTEELKEVLGYLVNGIVKLNTMLMPFLPETSQKIAKIFPKSGKINLQKSLFPRLN